MSLLNDSLMPNTILTLMYNIFKVREEETLYKPRSVQSSGLGLGVSRINGKYKNKPTGYKGCKDCPHWFLWPTFHLEGDLDGFEDRLPSVPAARTNHLAALFNFLLSSREPEWISSPRERRWIGKRLLLSGRVTQETGHIHGPQLPPMSEDARPAVQSRGCRTYKSEYSKKKLEPRYIQSPQD